MKLIGLTGGIGSGKSTVSDYFKSKGAIIIDADLITKKVNNSVEVIDEMIATFGDDIDDGMGNIDTKKLADLIFNNKGNMEKIQNISVPKILDEIDRQIELQKHTDNIVILDVPLLLEYNLDIKYNLEEVWVISVPVEMQIERVMKRNNYTREHALARINNQMPISEKIKRATKVIDNSKDLTCLYNQLNELLPLEY